MKSGEKTYVWQLSSWPSWSYDSSVLRPLLAQVYREQGRLQGRMYDLGLDVRDNASLSVLTTDVLKTSEIEGERLSLESVRSSVARKLGVDIGALAPPDRHVDGVVDMLIDATHRHSAPLSVSRLFGWHAAMFPTGFSGLAPIRVAQWRDDASGPMQVVSGPLHKHRVHFEAPPACDLDQHMHVFIDWFNASATEDPVLKAGLAHLWFVTVHPFEDGNGRIARALCDMALARAESGTRRFYSLSAQIQAERKTYYKQLETAQQGNADVTEWLVWFLDCMLRALNGAETSLEMVLGKARFWQYWAGTALNERQVKVLNKMLDGLVNKASTSKWASIGKCSQDTALRDMADLVQRGMLQRSAASGRSTSYELVRPT